MRLHPALIIPPLNEALVIGEAMRRVPDGLFRLIAVADNGSTHRGGEIARDAGAVVVVEPRRGYGAACLTPLDALPPEIDTVVFCRPTAPRMRARRAARWSRSPWGEADLVIGSRVAGKTEPGAPLAYQTWGNWLNFALIRWLYGFRYTDPGPSGPSVWRRCGGCTIFCTVLRLRLTRTRRVL